MPWAGAFCLPVLMLSVCLGLEPRAGALCMEKGWCPLSPIIWLGLAPRAGALCMEKGWYPLTPMIWLGLAPTYCMSRVGALCVLFEAGAYCLQQGWCPGLHELLLSIWQCAAESVFEFNTPLLEAPCISSQVPLVQ